jgi:hypothetical protein
MIFLCMIFFDLTPLTIPYFMDFIEFSPLTSKWIYIHVYNFRGLFFIVITTQHWSLHDR